MWLVRQNASALTYQVASELAALLRPWIRHCWHHGTRTRSRTRRAEGFLL